MLPQLAFWGLAALEIFLARFLRGRFRQWRPAGPRASPRRAFPQFARRNPGERSRAPSDESATATPRVSWSRVTARRSGPFPGNEVDILHVPGYGRGSPRPSGRGASSPGFGPARLGADRLARLLVVNGVGILRAQPRPGNPRAGHGAQSRPSVDGPGGRPGCRRLPDPSDRRSGPPQAATAPLAPRAAPSGSAADAEPSSPGARRGGPRSASCSERTLVVGRGPGGQLGRVDAKAWARRGRDLRSRH